MIKQAAGMTLIGHIGELRKRVIWMLVVLVAATAGGFFAAGPLIRYMIDTELPAGVDLNAFSPFDSIRLYMKFAFVLGLTVTIPFMLFQLWRFVKPGLRPHEQRATLACIPLAAVLFALGLSFGYFVLFKMMLAFTFRLAAGLEIGTMYGVNQYFSSMLNILLPVGIVFELPVIVLFLTTIRLLNPQRLRKLRRYAYMLLVVVSAVIAPPDFVSPIIVAIPLILLFEASVWLSNRIYRKREKQVMGEAA